MTILMITYFCSVKLAIFIANLKTNRASVSKGLEIKCLHNINIITFPTRKTKDIIEKSILVFLGTPNTDPVHISGSSLSNVRSSPKSYQIEMSIFKVFFFG